MELAKRPFRYFIQKLRSASAQVKPSQFSVAERSESARSVRLELRLALITDLR